MKECLQCKNEFESESKKAKFCSVNCRVAYHRAHGKKGEIREDVLMNMISELNKKLLMQIENAAFPPITYPKKEDRKEIWKPTKVKKEEHQPYDGVKMKTFTDIAYDAGLPVEIDGVIIQKDSKPLRENFKDGFEYSIALAEWKEK